jgi:hypothetical protein
MLMRLALLADVHGNLAALRAVATAVEASAASESPFDHVIVAGDLMQGGPSPRDTDDKSGAPHNTLAEQRQVPYDAQEEQDATLTAGMPPWEPLRQSPEAHP